MRDHLFMSLLDRSLTRVATTRIGGRRLSSVLLVAAVAVTAVAAWLPWIRGETKYNGYLDWTGFDDWADGFLLIFLALAYLVYVRLRGALIEVEPRARWLPLVVALLSVGVWWIAFERAGSLVYVGPENGARIQVGLYVEVVALILGLAGALIVVREDRASIRPPTPRPNRDAVPTERVR